MKQLILSVLTLSTLTATAQLRLKVGPNMAYFTKGNEPSGIDKATVSFTGAVDYKASLSNHVKLTPTIYYIGQGGKNSLEGGLSFKTYSVGLSAPIGYRIGIVELSAGPYVERLVYARNWQFDGEVFGWSTKRWTYWNQYDYGLTGGLELDLNGASIQVQYKRGLKNVKGTKEKFDDRYDGCKNAGVQVMLILPFKTFFE